MSKYSPNWSPGTPLEDDEKISQAEKERLVRESKVAGNFTDADEKEFYDE
jgi:hypothetical protein